MQVTIKNGQAHYVPTASKPFSLPTTAATPAEAVRQHINNPTVRLLCRSDASALTLIMARNPSTTTTTNQPINFTFSEPHTPEAPLSPFLAAVTVTARALSGPATTFTLIYNPAHITPTIATAARFVEATAEAFEPNPYLYALNQQLPIHTQQHARAAYRAHTTARRISRFTAGITQQERVYLHALTL